MNGKSVLKFIVGDSKFMLYFVMFYVFFHLKGQIPDPETLRLKMSAIIS